MKRSLLRPFALIYRAVTRLRNRMFDSGSFASTGFSLPVISVGNLSVGGTGKTPHVEYLVRLLQSRFKPATMSRGYKRRTKGFRIAGADADAAQIGDEPMQYHLKFPGLVVSVANERVTGIPGLLYRHPEIEVILLDDAYQHRSVKPGLNILLTRFDRPFYEDDILPLGSLREDRAGYSRADIIIVSKCPPGLPAEQAEAMIRRISPFPNQEVFFSCIRYGTPYDMFSGEAVSLSGKQVLLVCGIADPAGPANEAERLAEGVELLSWRDHHYFTKRDLERISEAFSRGQPAGKLILTTEKDATRLHLHAQLLKERQLPVAVLPVEVEILFGQRELLDRKVITFVEKTIAEQDPPGEQEFPGGQKGSGD